MKPNYPAIILAFVLGFVTAAITLDRALKVHITHTLDMPLKKKA